jgi:hypothetical protein
MARRRRGVFGRSSSMVMVLYRFGVSKFGDARRTFALPRPGPVRHRHRSRPLFPVWHLRVIVGPRRQQGRLVFVLRRIK